MALTPGTRLGVYEVTAQLGVGGMGEVYRATDTKLKRHVAIKILPSSLAADSDRLARFQREAEVLASLNHPNIAAIYGLEDADGVKALVMELVEGEDLSQRIAFGAIPIDEALPIAKQIAEALEAAHEQGIIHRDLKPANIKLRPDGAVKVLDFGLAKLAPVGATAGPSGVTASPTITSPAMMTGVGVLLGTAAYMSPEQAKGRIADKRSDIWAFGCVLYEMLTGKRPFDGEDVSDTLANVLKIDPDWSALPSEIPPAIRTLLQSCLTKDRRRRVADISTALFVLEKAASLAAPASGAPLPRGPWRRLVTPVAAALVTWSVVGAVLWFATRAPEAVPPRLSRLYATPSGTAALTVNGADRDLAITPDGSRLIYVGIVSPNGRWLAYEANDSGRFEIFVVPFPEVSGRRETVSTAGGTRPLWARDGQELFYVSPTGAVMRVGVGRGPSWVATNPTVVVKEGYFTIPPNPGRTYDIAADGRFLMIKYADDGGTTAPASIVVVQQWVEELKRLVPTK